MSSEEIFKRIGAYVDGELPAVEREKVEEYLRKHPECSEAAEDWQWLDQVAGGESVPSISSEEWTRVGEGVLQQAKREPPKVRRAVVRERRFLLERLVPLFSLAALVLIGVFIGWHLVTTPEEPSPSADPVKEPPIASSDVIDIIEGPRPRIEEGDDDSVHLHYEDF